MQLIVPALFVIIAVYATVKRVDVFKSFCLGVGDAVKFMLDVLPTLVVIFMMCEVFERSGISAMFERALSPALQFFKIPQELTKLILIKPFSGSGSLTYLTKIVKTYGADAYIARCACVLFGSSETVFYISAVYFAKHKGKKLGGCIVIILLCTFISTVVACWICTKI